jgi:pimeloyl-ACP methyl ester carboxylesterase
VDERRSTVAERMIDVNGVELCTEPFGDPFDPPILLVMGIGGSMLWWEEGFCRMLADGGRFVIRYDHRDTGRSVTYPLGRPGYTGADLTADAAGVLDAYGIAAAHLVGASAGGGMAQELALDYADRVLSLVLISTSPVTPGDRGLPPPSDEFERFVSTARVDWSDPDSVIEYLIAYQRVLAGGRRPFDEVAARDLVRRDVARARDFAAVQNHDVLAEGEAPSKPLSAIAAPTLVIHGTADPMFPLKHGEALAEEIPGTRLLTLDGAGHGIDRADWEAIVPAVLEHTAADEGVEG